MYRRGIIALLLVAPLLSFQAKAASAAATVPASGTFTQTSFAVTGSHTSGNVTFLNFEGTDSLTGTFTGTSSLVAECTAVPSGKTRCKVDEAFTGAVNGVSGQLRFLALVEINGTAVEGRFIVVGSSGGLAGTHGQGTFSGANGTGTYSGTLILG